MAREDAAEQMQSGSVQPEQVDLLVVDLVAGRVETVDVEEELGEEELELVLQGGLEGDADAGGLVRLAGAVATWGTYVPSTRGRRRGRRAALGGRSV